MGEGVGVGVVRGEPASSGGGVIGAAEAVRRGLLGCSSHQKLSLRAHAN